MGSLLSFLVLLSFGYGLEAEPAGTAIRPPGHLVLDGKRIFPIELYSVRTDEDFALARAHGFNAGIEDVPGIEDRARRHGMILTVPHWFERKDSDQAAIDAARRCRRSPAVIAHNLNDEPDLRLETSSPADLERFARILRREDPARWLSVTCAGGAGGTAHWKDYAALVDIFRIDPYPVVAGQPLSLLADLLRQARQAAGPEKPVWTVLQAWTLGPGTGFPSASQDRCMTYLALVGGARGLSHFDLNFDVWTQHPDFWNGLIRNNLELHRLSPILLAGTPVRTTSSHPHVHVAAWTWHGSAYLVAVNDQEETSDTTLRIHDCPGLPANPDRLFAEHAAERRSDRLELVVESGGSQSLSLRLGPYEVLVCRFRISRWARRWESPSGIVVESPGVEILAQEGNRWARIKNATEQPVTARIRWPRETPAVCRLDLAFRPMEWVAAQRAGGPVTFPMEPQGVCEIGARPPRHDLAGEYREFRLLGLSLRFTSPYPAEGGFSVVGQRYRGFAGATLPVHLEWTSESPVDPGTVCAWGTSRAGRVRALPRDPAAANPCRSGTLSFDVELPKPERPDRDEELSFTVARGRTAVRRIVRFRPEEPFDLILERSEESTSWAAHVVLESRFPGYRLGGLTVDVDAPGPGWQAKAVAQGGFRYRLEIAPPRDGSAEGRVGTSVLRVQENGRTIQRSALPAMLVSGGGCITASQTPREVHVARMASRVIPDGDPGEDAWGRASALAGFLGIGAAEFSDRQPKARIGWDDLGLYVCAELPSAGGLCARAAAHDVVHPADDRLELYFVPSPGADMHVVFVNAAGQTADFTVKSDERGQVSVDRAWESQAKAGVRVLDQSWRVELFLPWLAFPRGAPAAGAAWRFNVRTPHGVAPRTAEVYSYCREWQVRPEDLCTLVFEGPDL